MDVDTQIMEELKRGDAKAAAVLQLDGGLIAVTVAVLGIGEVPTPARVLMGAAQVLLLAALVPLLLAVFPRVFGRAWSGNGAPIGLAAWSAGRRDDPVDRRRALATRARVGYRMVGVSMVIVMVALVALVAAGILVSFGGR